MYGNIHQNNAQWRMARCFNFTSSELHKLLTKAKSGSGMSKTAETYIFDKLAETLTNGDCLNYTQADSKEIRWGHYWESEARFRYEDATGVSVETCGYIPYNDFFGGSPDGLVGEDGGIEIKCPYNSAVHVRYLMMTEPKDLQEFKPEYYAQIQGNLLTTGRQWFDFVAFDPRMKNEAQQLKVLRIPRDEEFIARCIEALEAAQEVRRKYESKLIEML
ncbi:MAG: YqaJ viral recombinase family protein [Alistipes sp.]|nr:YqaJ viral recombinase family protein [Alistipes sp.]MBQ6862238.1 YqaJ viral recombinase family protein [Alistipes sp.]